MQNDEGGEWKLIRTDVPIEALELQALQKQGAGSCCHWRQLVLPASPSSALSPLSAETPERVSPADPLPSQKALLEVLDKYQSFLYFSVSTFCGA